MGTGTLRILYVIVALAGLVTCPWSSFAADLPPDAQAPQPESQGEAMPGDRTTPPGRHQPHLPHMSAISGCGALIGVLAVGLTISIGGRYLFRKASRRIIHGPPAAKPKPGKTNEQAPKSQSPMPSGTQSR